MGKDEYMGIGDWWLSRIVILSASEKSLLFTVHWQSFVIRKMGNTVIPYKGMNACMQKIPRLRSG